MNAATEKPTPGGGKPRMSDDRLKYWLDFAKIIVTTALGTAAVGIVTVLVNGQIQQKQVDQKAIVSSNEHLSKFKEIAVGNNTAKRRALALFFSKLAPTPKARSRWDDYLQWLDFETKINNVLNGKFADALSGLRRLKSVWIKEINTAVEENDEIKAARMRLAVRKVESEIAQWKFRNMREGAAIQLASASNRSRVKFLILRIDKLAKERAIALAINPPVANDSCFKNVLAARFPNSPKRWLTDSEVAKAVLKVRVVLMCNPATDLLKWESSLARGKVKSIVSLELFPKSSTPESKMKEEASLRVVSGAVKSTYSSEGKFWVLETVDKIGNN